MRWIDINLPEPETNRKFDNLVAEAVVQLAELGPIQKRDGLDNITILHQMTKVGGLLFQGVISLDPQAFDPSEKRTSSMVPLLDDPQHDDLVGYHLVLDPAWPSLPWNWLHNGVGFLMEKHPIVTSNHGSSVPTGSAQRPWMQRFQRAEYLVGDDGSDSLTGILNQLLPPEQASCEFLFVPGHTDDKIKRMIYREAEAIEGAVESTHLSRPLAKFHVPRTAVTPGELSKLSLTFQALHFAGPVSQTTANQDQEQANWMDQMVQDMNTRQDHELEATVGLEGEVLGVDPITSLLDDVCHSYDQEQLVGQQSQEKNTQENGARGSAGSRGPGSTPTPTTGSNPWLLDDGPVDPESLGRAGGIPPLVFSNSYRALPELGQRFIAAGASTFIGPVVPLFSRPARIFSGYCYQALGDGWCAGAAVWKAAQSCRQELGTDHPAWLSYGVHGYGTLALHYL